MGWFASDEPWAETSRVGVIALAGFAAAAIYFELLAPDRWFPLLGSANLAFHEAGHMIYRVFGDTMMWLGGTLGQLTFPLIALFIFFRRRQTMSMVGAAIWAAQSLLNVATYAEDARARTLDERLVGGGEHDWAHMLGQWGVLRHDHAIAGTMRVVALATMVGLIGWLVWREQRRQPWWR